MRKKKKNALHGGNLKKKKIIEGNAKLVYFAGGKNLLTFFINNVEVQFYLLIWTRNIGFEKIRFIFENIVVYISAFT
jgi:hypothetical protein